MGKKILKLLLYLMAVVGVLIWLDGTVGLTEEGALIIFGIALLMYFVMKLIGFLTKRHRIRRERARKARRKRELREVNNYRVKQETSVAATAASQANHRKQQKIHNQSGHKFHMTRKKNSLDRRFAGHILHRCAGRENLDPAARADSGEPS